MSNSNEPVATLWHLVVAIVVLSVLALSGCITAFAPASDPCTRDPKDTSVRLCTPEELRQSQATQDAMRRQSSN